MNLPAPGRTNNPKGGKPDKLIRDALLAAHRQSPHKLKSGIEAVWDKFATGDKDAVQFITERIDGKAMQGIELSGVNGGPIESVITDVDKDVIANYLNRTKK